MISLKFLFLEKYRTLILITVSALFTMLALTACKGGDGVSLSGNVSAPGGGMAFNPPSKLEQMFASIFGKYAIADVSGVSSVGSGVTIKLFEVDENGNIVGDALASTTTDADGQYSLTARSRFTPDSKYIIRAVGASENMDVRVTDTTNNVDPITTAVSELITSAASDLSRVSVEEVAELQNVMDNIAQNIDASSFTTASAMSSAVQTEAINDEETNNQINSIAAAGSICGNVQDASGENLANIRIVVRDFGNWVTRARSRTDSDGNYCVSVPDGEYILGALNFTNTSMAASEWWHTSGTKYSQIDAEKITVSASASVTRNFSLEAGARIEGTIKAAAGGSLAAGTALEGIKVQVRKFQNFFPVAGKRSNAEGLYRINVIAGTYNIGVRNGTLKAYASQYYNGSTGVNTYYESTPVTLSTGTTTTINFDLEKGYKLSGTILDSAGGNAVTGMRVRVNRASSDGGGAAQRLRTNKEGKYRIWLKPGTYFIQSYGQVSADLDMTAANASYSPVGPVTTISTNIKYNGNGVSQAKAWLLDNSGNTVSQELSNSDGSIKLYCKTCDVNYMVYVRIDDSKDWGTTVYSGKTDISTNATLVDATQTTMSDITLLAGGTLNVSITSDGTTAQKNFKTRVMTGGAGSDYLIKTQRTRGDGTYILSIPAGTYRVQMRDDGNAECPVTITAGSTTNLNYRTDTNACS